jgi:Cu-Zn family superoxide dismutase
MPVKRFVLALAAGTLCAGATMGYWPQGAQPKGGRGIPPRFAPLSGAVGGVTKAVAVMIPTKGSDVSGTVTFSMAQGGVRVQAHIRGLKPGKHGFHIHEFGDASSPDGMAAGGHFNPLRMDHAGPHDRMRHVGDLGNIEANDKGEADYDLVDPQLSFFGPTSILGRGLIIHEKADDLKTQPTGNAGGRLACGVIGVAKGS